MENKQNTRGNIRKSTMKTTEPVKYIEKTRSYYEAQGFGIPYQWTRHSETPITPLKKALKDSTVALITTAATYPRTDEDIRFVDSVTVDPLPVKLYADDLSWDKKATHLDDIGSYLPLAMLKQACDRGRIVAVADRFHCVPTEYSQRQTIEHDAPEILHRCREDGADIALLVPL